MGVKRARGSEAGGVSKAMCKRCRFWEAGYSLQLVPREEVGLCRYMPKAEYKKADEWCGQFEERDRGARDLNEKEYNK